MTGYSFALSCLACGGEMLPVANGAPVAGTHVTAVCRCGDCDWGAQVTVTLRPMVGTQVGERRKVRVA